MAARSQLKDNIITAAQTPEQLMSLSEPKGEKEKSPLEATGDAIVCQHRGMAFGI